MDPALLAYNMGPKSRVVKVIEVCHSKLTDQISTLISHSSSPQVDLAALTRQILLRSVERTIYVLRDMRIQKPVWDDFISISLVFLL